MKLKSLIFPILLFGLISTQAQTVIQGRIRNAAGTGIGSVSVSIKNISSKTILAYAFSNETGSYKLTLDNTAPDSVNLVVSGLNIETKTVRIKNASQTLNVVINEKEQKLKEVIVKQQKVWVRKDTVNYLVSAFIDKKDLVIGDVLKKMPGITVDKDGGIMWQGKPIYPFYIENMNLLQGRYGIATNNVAANDVATVQVLEHHEPVKALEGLVAPSQTAAINLKLKEEAKGRLSIMSKLGLGAAPVQWENEVVPMIFAKNWQNITTYKGNNAGVDLSSEIYSFNLSVRFDGDNMLYVNTPNSPGIDKKRYLFNNSNVVTVNTILKTDSNETVTVNLAYLNSQENKKGSAITSYFIPGKENMVVSEDMNSNSNTNRLDADITYDLNNKKKNLTNRLNISALWDDVRGDVISNQTIHQELRKPTFSITDKFDWTIRTGEKKGFQVNTTLGFKSIPQELTITPGMYPGLLNNGQDYNLLKQETRVNNFNINNQIHTYSPISIGDFSLNPRVELNGEYRNLTSQMHVQDNTGMLKPIETDSMRNNLDWTRYNAIVALPLSYRNSFWDIRLSLPINYNYIVINNKIRDDKQYLHRLYFQPRLSILYHATAKLDLSANYGYNNSMGNVLSFYPGYILSGYRSLSRSAGRIYESQTEAGEVNVSYRDIINMLFFTTNVSYTRNKSNLLNGQNFEGILSVNSPIERDNKSNIIGIGATITKGFDWKRLSINFNPSYSITSSKTLQENELIDYKSKGLYVRGSLTCKPIEIMNLEYRSSWSKSQTVIANSVNTTEYSSWTNDVKLDIDLPKDFIITAVFEHYYNSATTTNKNLSFIDLGLTYIWNKTHISLDWNNILNTTNYVTYRYDGINSFQNSYRIRPATIMLKVSLQIK
jgi:hypothetical protein